MTYPMIVVPFVLITAVVTLLSVRRPAFGRRMRASALAALVLVVLTAVFDNIMIAVGLFSYPPQHLSGIRIGLAPLEDFAYPVCAAFLVPALFTLVSARREPA
ncbi:lycopene cyclase domain-containing protein [Microbacterium sp. B19]|nr:lycopene cyclase domain-containing protein [Microbacterium sp. B19]